MLIDRIRPLFIPFLSLAYLLPSSRAEAQLVSEGGAQIDPIMQRLLNPGDFGLAQGEWQNGRCGNIRYWPTSSNSIERRMCRSERAIGAMDRPFLQQLICDDDFCNGTDEKAVQASIAINQITLLRNDGGSDPECDTQISGEDWKLTIRTLFAGSDGSGSPEACAAQDRIDLVNNWGALWSNGCAEPSGCTQLHHIYRPDERSGMVQVLAFLVGIRDFCNGGAQDDNDPIRRPCRDNERYCTEDGTLGLVLPIKIPVPEEPVAEDYFAAINNGTPCKQGAFDFTFSDPVSKSEGACPDGEAEVAGFLCLYPVDDAGLFGCNNEFENPSVLAPLMDGRVYNEIPQNPDGGYPGEERTAGDFREFYRIHAGCPSGVRNSSDHLGCLTSKSQCSIGVGDMRIQRERATNPGLGLVQLDENKIGTPRYPLNQHLYINTINGFDTAVGEEAKLVDCITNHPDWVRDAVFDMGYVGLRQVEFSRFPCDEDPFLR